MPIELAKDPGQLGHDADTVLEESLGGAPDKDVVTAAHQAGRVLLTLDKGIANLQQYPLHQHAGLVLFRPIAWAEMPSFFSSSKGFTTCLRSI